MPTGTAASTSASREACPTTRSIAWTSSTRGPTWRSTNSALDARTCGDSVTGCSKDIRRRPERAGGLPALYLTGEFCRPRPAANRVEPDRFAPSVSRTRRARLLSRVASPGRYRCLRDSRGGLLLRRLGRTRVLSRQGSSSAVCGCHDDAETRVRVALTTLVCGVPSTGTATPDLRRGPLDACRERATVPGAETTDAGRRGRWHARCRRLVVRVSD